MSVISIPIPENVGLPSSEQPVGIPPAPESIRANCLDTENLCQKSDDVEKCLGPISENARNQIWMCPDLSIYSNSEYVYAIFPLAVALFWGKGGREIPESVPLSTICAILSLTPRIQRA